MSRFSFARPEDVEEAAAAARRGAMPLAGGTDAVVLLRRELARAEQVVDLKPLPWREIRQRDGGLELGALATLEELAQNPLVKERALALAQACAAAATPQIRRVATLGGNLVQAPRCPYFRSGFACLRAPGGTGCPPQDQGGETRHLAAFPGACIAAHPSDAAVALIALGATVVTTERELAIEELYRQPTPDDPRDVVLRPGELVTSLRLPGGGASAYQRMADRGAWAFALASAAAWARVEDGRLAEVRLGLGGVAALPLRAVRAEEALRGASVMDAAALERAAQRALDGARPLPGAAYKVRIARVLVRRALEAL